MWAPTLIFSTRAITNGYDQLLFLRLAVAAGLQAPWRQRRIAMRAVAVPTLAFLCYVRKRTHLRKPPTPREHCGKERANMERVPRVPSSGLY